MAINAWAQNRYVVYFPDKANSIYSTDSPEAFLSTRAIERRANQNIDLEASDLPVNAWYLDSLEKYGIEPYFISKWFNAVVVEATETQIQEVESKEFVLKYEYAAPGSKLAGSLEPVNDFYESNDPESSTADSYRQLEMMNVQAMHADGFTGDGIWIAIFDAGFQGANLSSVFAHLFENGKIKDLKDFTTGGGDVFDYDDHGTNVFSCVGAKYNNQLVGPAYGSDYSLYVTEDDGEYRIEEYNWLFAAERADSAGVDIISSSLGYNLFDDTSMNYTYDDTDGQTAVISRAAKMASAKGMLVVSSAGNEGNVSWNFITMPADVDDVLAVGSVNSSNVVSSTSSKGPTIDGRIKPDVVALGSSTTVLHGTNKIGTNTGTSFSAPLVAGLAAGLWQFDREMTNEDLKNLILFSSDRANDPDNAAGYGLPDYRMATGSDVLSVDDVFSDRITVFPNPFTGDRLFVKIERKFRKQDIRFELYSPDGRLINTTNAVNVRPGEILELDIKDRAKGVYMLKIFTKKQTKIVRLLRL